MIVVAGSLNMDLVGHVPQLPAWGETVMGDGFSRFAGGKGGNQAVAAARLGAAVAFVGAVGDDPFGHELRAGLVAEGIDASGVQVVDAATGCALIHVRPDGDNAITVLPGANRLAPLPPSPWPAAWRCLLLQLEIPLPATRTWAEAARGAGAQVVLNAAPMSTLPASLLQHVDLLVVNEGELQALTATSQSPVAPPLPLSAALQAAAAHGPSVVVATLGARGLAAWTPDGLQQWPGHAVPVVDSTGAGDTFVGALAAALWQQQTLSVALARANAAAAISCTRPGARGGMPTATELDTWMTR